MVRKVQQSDLVLLLYDLNAELNVQCEWGRFRPTLVVGIGNDNAALFQFAILLHDLCGVRPQDRIGEIADHALWPSTPPALLAETDEQVAPSGGCRLTEVLRQTVDNIVRDFIEKERRHMQMEERVLFPAAAKALLPEDWAEIDARLCSDPSLDRANDEKFNSLRERILRWEQENTSGMPSH